MTPAYLEPYSTLLSWRDNRGRLSDILPELDDNDKIDPGDVLGYDVNGSTHLIRCILNGSLIGGSFWQRGRQSSIGVTFYECGHPYHDNELSIESRDRRGRSPLHHTVSTGHIEATKWLLSKKANSMQGMQLD